DLLGQVAVGHGGGDCRDVADLSREIAGHGVHGVRQVFPGAGSALDSSLATQTTVGANLACDAGDLRSEGVELVNHCVDGVFQLEDLAPLVDRDLLGQIPVRHGGGHIGDIADLGGQIAAHGIHGVR